MLKLFYLSIAIFPSVCMFLYLFAQFALYKYMLEREKEIINSEDCSFLIDEIE
ncbi:hypothetical protein JJC04_12825 [Flavobacterium covae]|nr:hypothetical protein [Flavobacterium covae]QYS90821.1 hypothetical protein JJC04_12825 [Flavobacterium covae]